MLEPGLSRDCLFCARPFRVLAPGCRKKTRVKYDGLTCLLARFDLPIFLMGGEGGGGGGGGGKWIYQHSIEHCSVGKFPLNTTDRQLLQFSRVRTTEVLITVLWTPTELFSFLFIMYLFHFTPYILLL